MEIGFKHGHGFRYELLLNFHKQIVGGGVVQVKGATVDLSFLTQLLNGHLVDALVFQDV